MRLMSTLSLLAAAVPFVGGGVSITVNVSVDSNVASVAVKAGNQSMSASANESATWAAWTVDTDYVPTLAGVAEGYTGKWRVTADGLSTLSGGNGDAINLSQSYAGCSLSFYGEPNTYKVTLDRQSGGGGTASVTATYGAAMPMAEMPTRTGYEFCAYTNSTGVTYYNADGTSARPWDKTSDATLYAQWRPAASNVTFDRRLGTGGTESVTTTYGAAMPKVEMPTRPGFDFLGYTSAPNGGGTKYYNADGSSARTWDKTEATTLYAYWAVITNTVFLNPQGGINGSTSVTATYASPMPPITLPVRPGFKFHAYRSEPGGAGTRYYNAKGASARKWDQTTDATLYAQWLTGTYAVLLNRQGGTGGTESITATYGAAMPMAEMPTRAGFDFLGYTTAPNGAGVQYYKSDGSSARSWNVASNATLFANWATNSYLVQFNGNGGSGAMPDLPCAYNVPARLPTNVFTNAGFAFAGWATSESGSVVYGDGAVVTNLAATGTVPLFAKWTARTYEIGYDNIFFLCEFAANVAACESMSESGSVSVDAGNAGKVVISASDGVVNAEISSRYARTDLATAGMHSFPVEGGESYTISCTLNKRNGDKPAYIGVLFFDASGGYIDPNGAYSEEGEESHELTAPSSAARMALFFKAKCSGGESVEFSKIKVCKTLPYSLVSNSAVRKTFTYGPSSKYGSLSAPTRTGYTFRWWDNGNGTEVSAETPVRPECTTLFSTWAAKAYPVKLDPQGGSNGTPSVTATYGAAMPMAEMPTRAGFDFLGYTTAPNGAGTKYYNADGTSARTWDLDKTGVTTLYAYWIENAPEEPTTYKVTLDPQGGSNGTASVSATYGAAMPTNGVTMPTRDGYDFGGYWTETGGSGTQYYNADGTSATNWNIAADTTLYASWTLKPHEPDPLAVALDAPDFEFTTFGTVGSSGQLNETRTNLNWFAQTDFAYYGTSAAQSHALPVFASGYQVYCSWLTTTVEGKGVLSFWWKCAAKPRQSYESSTGYKTYGDIFRFGVCDKGRFGLVDKLEGSSDWVHCAYTNNTDGEVMLAWAFTYADYAGRVTSNGGGTGWVDRVEWKPFSDEPPDDPEPQYSTFTITLEPSPGTGGTPSVTATYGAAMPPAEMPTRTGYGFGGYTNSTGTTYYNSDGASARTWDITSNTTLYAQWQPNTYEVAFNSNDGTGSMNPLQCTYDAPTNLTRCAFTRTGGYTFVGWSTNSTAETIIYTNCAEVVNLATGGVFTLYAKWDTAAPPTTCYVTLNKNYGGSTSGAGINLISGSDITQVKVNAITRTGYDFLGYFTSPEGGERYFDENGYGIGTWNITSDHFTLYAHWALHEYTVTLDPQGGSGGDTNVMVHTNALMPKAKMPERAGYKFLGYYENTNGGGTQYYDADGSSAHEWNKTHDATISAHWEPLTYEVTLELDGGVTTNVTVTYDAKMPPITPPTRTGYTFGGYTNEVGTLYYNSYGTSASDWDLASDTTLYAQWNPNTYEVAFNGNDADDGEMANQTLTYDVATNLTPCAFKRTGYTFAGWTNSTGTAFADGAVVSNLTKVSGMEVPLYAKWTAKTYTVTFNDGSGTASTSITYGASITPPSSRTGYTFGGYFTEPSGKGTKCYNADGSMAESVDESTISGETLYAYWVPIEYTVTLNQQGGSNGTATVTATYGAAMPMADIQMPTREGYTFGGYWTETGGGGTQYYNASGTSASDWDLATNTALYAQWVATGYTVTLDAGDGIGFMTNSVGEEVSLITDFAVTIGCAWNLPTAVTNINPDLVFAGWAYVKEGVTNALPSVVTSLSDGVTNLVATWGGALAVALDAPGLVFSTKGTVGSGSRLNETGYTADWFVQKNCGVDGSDAVQSGALPQDVGNLKVYVSWLTTTVEGKGVLSFSWKRDAQTTYKESGDIYGDILRFGTVSGNQFTELPEDPKLTDNTGWQNVTYTNNQEGPITFAWAFTYRDGVGNGGGTGYVDRVTWTPSE